MSQVPDIIVSAIVFLAAAVLFVAGIGVVGLGAWVWANSIAAVARARSHSLSAQEQEVLTREAHEALDDARDKVRQYDRPSDDDLRDSVRSSREFNTLTTNEEIEERSPIEPDKFYVARDDEEEKVTIYG